MTKTTIEKNIPMPNPRGSSISGKLRELLVADIGDSMAFYGVPNHRLSALATQVGGKGWYTLKTIKDSDEQGGEKSEYVRVWKKAEPNVNVNVDVNALPTQS